LLIIWIEADSRKRLRQLHHLLKARTKATKRVRSSPV
jgi:hypothetical protein